MPKITWGDLFSYLEERCDFHEKIPGDKNSVTWNCGGGNDKSFTKEFCEDNKLSFPIVEMFCDFTGGHCDCEVLFNSTKHLKDKDPVGTMRTIKWDVSDIRFQPPPVKASKFSTKDKKELR